MREEKRFLEEKEPCQCVDNNDTWGALNAVDDELKKFDLEVVIIDNGSSDYFFRIEKRK